MPRLDSTEHQLPRFAAPAPPVRGPSEPPSRKATSGNRQRGRRCECFAIAVLIGLLGLVLNWPGPKQVRVVSVHGNAAVGATQPLIKKEAARRSLEVKILRPPVVVVDAGLASGVVTKLQSATTKLGPETDQGRTSDDPESTIQARLKPVHSNYSSQTALDRPPLSTSSQELEPLLISAAGRQMALPTTFTVRAPTGQHNTPIHTAEASVIGPPIQPPDTARVIQVPNGVKVDPRPVLSTRARTLELPNWAIRAVSSKTPSFWFLATPKTTSTLQRKWVYPMAALPLGASSQFQIEPAAVGEGWVHIKAGAQSYIRVIPKDESNAFVLETVGSRDDSSTLFRLEKGQTPSDLKYTYIWSHVIEGYVSIVNRHLRGHGQNQRITKVHESSGQFEFVAWNKTKQFESPLLTSRLTSREHDVDAMVTNNHANNLSGFSLMPREVSREGGGGTDNSSMQRIQQIQRLQEGQDGGHGEGASLESRLKSILTVASLPASPPGIAHRLPARPWQAAPEFEVMNSIYQGNGCALSSYRNADGRLWDKLLSRWHNITTSEGIPYALTFGTYIGWLRHESYIPYDGDMDIHIGIESMPKLLDLLASHPDWATTPAGIHRRPLKPDGPGTTGSRLLINPTSSGGAEAQRFSCRGTGKTCVGAVDPITNKCKKGTDCCDGRCSFVGQALAARLILFDTKGHPGALSEKWDVVHLDIFGFCGKHCIGASGINAMVLPRVRPCSLNGIATSCYFDFTCLFFAREKYGKTLPLNPDRRCLNGKWVKNKARAVNGKLTSTVSPYLVDMCNIEPWRTDCTDCQSNHAGRVTHCKVGSVPEGSRACATKDYLHERKLKRDENCSALGCNDSWCADGLHCTSTQGCQHSNSSAAVANECDGEKDDTTRIATKNARALFKAYLADKKNELSAAKIAFQIRFSRKRLWFKSKTKKAHPENGLGGTDGDPAATARLELNMSSNILILQSQSGSN